jgi:hypothetical protein
LSTPKKSVWTRVSRELGRAKSRYVDGFDLRDGAAALKRRYTSWAEKAERARVRRALVDAYRKSDMAAEQDTFLLVRIIGNDLEPRHAKGQAFANVEFILDHEGRLESCDTLWIVNRIVDGEEELRIVRLLESRKQEFVQVPFDLDAYAQTEWDLSRFLASEMRFSRSFEQNDPKVKARYEIEARRLKNLYLMNNNGARNLALTLGRSRAKWTLPWDGNCFLTAEAWQSIREAVRSRPYLPYVIVPMARVTDNALMRDPTFVPSATEEPQIIFRRDTDDLFNEDFPYGRRPKVEMLWRLGVPGNWDRFRPDKWDFPRPHLTARAGLFQFAGWVARLNSGYAEQEIGKAGSGARAQSREAAIVSNIDRCDARAIERRLDSSRLLYYDETKLARLSASGSEAVQQLRVMAETAGSAGPLSVTDKTTVASSGDPHDYFHPAPYWWPDPKSPHGLPYVKRDGDRVPGTELFGPDSDRFDRTRLQRIFNDTTILALASAAFGEDRYAETAARLIRAWFIDPKTSMNPHLKYAQVMAGHHNDEGIGHGIIEFRDIHFMLDGVRLLERAGALTDDDRSAFRAWLTSYAAWLDDSVAARYEFRHHNNHGLFFDVQRIAIAAFLRDTATLARHRLFARERMCSQIAPDGSLPAELARPRPGHYVLFTLQGWTMLATILRSIGDDLWSYHPGSNEGIQAGLAWLAENIGTDSRLVADDSVDWSRAGPLLLDLREKYGVDVDGDPIEQALRKPVFHADEGIPPFWFLRRD